MNEELREKYAEEMFDCPYTHLSSWGQRHVDEVILKFQRLDRERAAAVANAAVGLPVETEHAKLQRDSERLARELESAKMENLELWDENSELKGELAELRANLNLANLEVKKAKRST